MLRSLKLKLEGPKFNLPPLYSEYDDCTSPRQPHCAKGRDGGCMAAKGEERSILSIPKYPMPV